MEPIEATIVEILTKPFRRQIRAFKRLYSWGKENVEPLPDDLLDVCKAGLL